MPDQFRAQRQDTMGPHSPSSNSDGPLSLVIGRGRNPGGPVSPSSRPKAQIIQHRSPGSSSGYSDHAQSSPPTPPPSHAQIIDQDARTGQDTDEAPLALVTDKSVERQRLDTVRAGDSGHEDGSSGSGSGGSSPARIPQPPQAHQQSYPSPPHRQSLSHEESRPFPSIPEGAEARPDVVLHKWVEPTADDQPCDLTAHSSEERVEIQPNITIAKVIKSNPAEEVVDEGARALPVEENPTAKSLGLKIRDFAMMLHHQEQQQQQHQQQQQQQIQDHQELQPQIEMPPRKPSTNGSLGHRPVDLDETSSIMSDVSSIDTWTSSLLGDAAQGGNYTFVNGVPIKLRMAKAPNGEIIYPCEFCDKAFANKYHLQSHVVTHTGERSFECRKCNKSFGRKSTLRAHMTTHTKTSNFMCPLCEKACNDNNSLEEHIRMHTGEKPFVCTICSKAYARKSHLNVHYRVHTGERPFVCVDCGKDFTEKRFLNDHMQTAHSGQDGPLKCPNCFREFAYKTSLKQHLKKQMCMKNINRGQGNGSTGAHTKQFQCPFCDKSYSWKQTLKQHVSMYHRNKVHTDEFWKYEMTKHRRVGVDIKVNDDMWKQQLGKHIEEEAANANQNSKDRATPTNGQLEQDPRHESKWLDQIQGKSQEDHPEKDEEVQAEMKLLALQSLKSSLHIMSMGMNPPQQMQRIQNGAQLPEPKPASPVVPRPPSARSNESMPPPSEPSTPKKECKPAPHQSQESYLSLLAQVRAHNKVDSKGDSTSRPASSKDNGSTTSHPSAQPEKVITGLDMLPDIKEEPAAKRTQMWLAQLGQYRQKSLQEELDRNHDELWEEQIARVKRNPVPSPLEPQEITVIEDSSKAAQKPKLPLPYHLQPQALQQQQQQQRSQVSVTQPQMTPLLPIQPRSMEAMVAANAVRADAEIKAKETNTPSVPALAPVAPPLLGNTIGHLRAQPTPLAPPRPRMIPMMSALQLHPQSNGFLAPRPKVAPSATITRPPPEGSDGAIKSLLTQPSYPECFKLARDQLASGEGNVQEVPKKKLTLPLENDLPKQFPSPPPAQQPSAPPRKREEEPPAGPSSFLKSFLLDPSAARKRMASDDYSVVPAKKSQPPTHCAAKEDVNDILRRRLLGLPDLPTPTPAPEPKTAQQPPVSAPALWNPAEEAAKLTCPSRGNVNQELLNIGHVPAPAQVTEERNQSQKESPETPRSPTGQAVEEPKRETQSQQQQPDYAHTSVLKHLLYRYTGSGKLP